MIQRLAKVSIHALSNYSRVEMFTHLLLRDVVEGQKTVEDDLERVDAELKLPLHRVDELELDVVSTGFSIIVDIMSNKIGIDRIQNLQQKIWKNNTKETNLETPPNEITQRTEHPHVLKATIRMTKEWREDRSLEFRFMLIASRPSANHRRPPHRGRLLIGRMAGLSPTSLPIGNLPAMVKSGDQDVITRI